MPERRDELMAQLAEWSASTGQGGRITLERQASVGLSQETWFGKAGAAGTPMVLRLPTPASGHRAILTQVAALELVDGRIPAPRILFSEVDDDNPLGAPFLIMDLLRGEVPVGWSDLEEPRRSKLATSAVDVLAELHRLPVEGDLAKGEVTTPAADLARLERRLQKLAPLPPVLTGALGWLGRRIPDPEDVPRLVHGDFRMGNFVIEGDEVTGILDWELSGTGDPMADLAWCFIPVWELSGVDEEKMFDAYATAAGVEFDRSRLDWYQVLSFVRLCYFALSGIRAFDSGRSSDFRLAALRYQLPVHLDRLVAAMSKEQIR